MRTPLLCTVLLLALPSTTVFSQSPKDGFGSDDLLNSVASEVRELERDQLEAFIEYDMRHLPGSKEKEFSCERAKTILEVKTQAARATRRLVHSIQLTDRVVKGS